MANKNAPAWRVYQDKLLKKQLKEKYGSADEKLVNYFKSLPNYTANVQKYWNEKHPGETFDFKAADAEYRSDQVTYTATLEEVWKQKHGDETFNAEQAERELASDIESYNQYVSKVSRSMGDRTSFLVENYRELRQEGPVSMMQARLYQQAKQVDFWKIADDDGKTVIDKVLAGEDVGSVQDIMKRAGIPTRVPLDVRVPSEFGGAAAEKGLERPLPIGPIVPGDPEKARIAELPRTTFIKGSEDLGILPQPFFSDENKKSEYEYIQKSLRQDGSTWSTFLSWALPKLVGARNVLYTGLGPWGITIGGVLEEEFLTQSDISKSGMAGIVSNGLFNALGIGVTALKYAIHSFKMPAPVLDENGNIVPPSEDPYLDKLANEMQDNLRGLTWVAESFMALSNEMSLEAKVGVARPSILWPNRGDTSEWIGGVPRKRVSFLEYGTLMNQRAGVDPRILSEEKVNAARDIYRTINEVQVYGNEYSPEYQQFVTEGTQNALSLMKEAIYLRMQYEDQYGAASWIREPERFDPFIEEVAFLELQLGRQLSIRELRVVKDYYTNAHTELAFQLIFDITNVPILGALTQGFTNIPAVARVLTKVGKQTGAIRAGLEAIPFIGWPLRATGATMATRVERSVNDVLIRFVGAYQSMPDAQNGLKEMQSLVADYISGRVVGPMPNNVVRRGVAKSFREARANFLDSHTTLYRVWDQGRQTIRGMENISFGDFKQLVDTVPTDPALFAKATYLNPNKWASALEDSVRETVDTFVRKETDRLQKEGLSPEQMGDVVARAQLRATGTLNELAVYGMAKKLSGEFIDNLRIFDGGHLLAGGVLGEITRVLRTYASTGKDVSNILNTSLRNGRFYNKVAAAGIKAGEAAQQRALVTAKFLEDASRFFLTIRDVWAMLVLTTPRWVLINLQDSLGRAVVNGVDPLDSLATLFRSTQHRLVDRVGFSPLEFGQSLARATLDVPDSVPNRILYEGWKPGAGPLSYWKYEHDRLVADYRKRVLNPDLSHLNDETAIAVSQMMPDMARIGIKDRTLFWLRAIPGATQDFNTAIEWTFRLRLFTKQYFKLLETLEPRFKKVGIEGLSPSNLALAERIWDMSEGNPAMIGAVVDSLRGLAKDGVKPSWTMLFPQGWTKKINMRPEIAERYTHLMREQIEDFIQKTVVRTGTTPSPTDWDKFFDEATESIQNEINLTVEHQNSMFRSADPQIGTDGKVADMPSAAEAKVADPEFVRVEAYIAIPNLRRRSMAVRFSKSGHIVNNYRNALGGVATVRLVPSGGPIKVTKEGKQVIVSLPKNLASRPKYALLDEIHDATKDVLYYTDKDFIDVAIGGKASFDEKFKIFLEDPEKLRGADDKALVSFFDLVESNKQIRDILYNTGVNTTSYASTYQKYKRYLLAERPELAGYRTAQQRFVDSVLPVSTERRLAALKHKDAFIRLMNKIESLPTKTANEATILFDSMANARANLLEFYRLVDPGPKATAPSRVKMPPLTARSRAMSSLEATRPNRWDMVEHQQALGYDAETEWIESLLADPNGIEDAIHQLNASDDKFVDWFLEINGVRTHWNSDHTVLNSIQLFRDGKWGMNIHDTNKTGWLTETIYQGMGVRGGARHEYYTVSMKDNPGIQIENALEGAFGMSHEVSRAWFRMVTDWHRTYKKWTKMPLNEYLSRLGFQNVTGSMWRLPPLTAENQFLGINFGLIRYDKETKAFSFLRYLDNQKDAGRQLFRETGAMVYKDIYEAATVFKSDDARAILDDIHHYIEVTLQRKVLNGKLNREQMNLFADAFEEYIKFGKAPNRRLYKPFDTMSQFLASAEGPINTIAREQLMDEAGEIFGILDGIFTKQKTRVPNLSAASIRSAFPNTDDDKILELINDWWDKTVAAPLGEDGTSLLTKAYRRIGFDDEMFMGTGDRSIGYIVPSGKYLNGRDAEQHVDLLRDKGLYPADATHDVTVDFIKKTHSVMYSYSPEQSLAILSTAPTREQIKSILSDLFAPRGREEFNLAIYIDTPTGRNSIDEMVNASNYDEVLAKTEKWLNDLAGTTTVDEIPTALPPNFSSLEEIPYDLAATLGSKVYLDDVNNAFSVWAKGTGEFRNVPETALNDMFEMKRFLRDRVASEPPAIAATYDRLLYATEAWENAFNKWKGLPTEFEMPPIPKFMLSDGMKTFITHSVDALSDYRGMLKGIEYLKNFMKTDEWKAPILSKEALDELQAWRWKASKAKSELVGTILNGGEVDGIYHKGAIAFTNDIMLDYGNVNNFDQLMKNIFPFWMFPSRSLPFWIKTMSTHPELIALYLKIQRASERDRYQAGAITSKGKPLPSFDGYVKMPGTDMWVNPLAPYSFRYALDILRYADSKSYEFISKDDDTPVSAVVADNLNTTAQIFGFSPAPWVSFIGRMLTPESENINSRFPIVPEISLIPRSYLTYLINLGRKTTADRESPYLGLARRIEDAIAPVPTWYDYLVEIKIYEDALEQLQSGSLTETQKKRLQAEVIQAVKDKWLEGNTLWYEAYNEMSKTNAAASAWSFFTGIYPKQFTEAKANLFAYRNRLTLLKSAMNNEFQSEVFHISLDDAKLWEDFNAMRDTPEYWIYRLYGLSGWVRDENDNIITDARERAKYNVLAIEYAEREQELYDKLDTIWDTYRRAVEDAGIGAPYSQISKAREDYFTQRDEIYGEILYDLTMGTNKPMSLIEKSIRTNWMMAIWSTRPVRDEGESYAIWQVKVADWEAQLPDIAQDYARVFFSPSSDSIWTRLQALHPDQQFNPEMVGMLIAETTPDGFDKYFMENDDAIDALNKAWEVLYFDRYWLEAEPLSGNEEELWLKTNQPPTAEELIAWVDANYPKGRFNTKQLLDIANGTNILTVPERFDLNNTAEERSRSHIFDMLSWMAPGRKEDLITRVEAEFVNNGGTRGFVDLFYASDGKAVPKLPGEALMTELERLQEWEIIIQTSLANLGISAPNEAQLTEYAVAQHENEMFWDLVEAELGISKDSLNAMLSEYYVDNTQRKVYRSEHQFEYETYLKPYWDMRYNKFGTDHRIWAKYYLWNQGTPPELQEPMSAPIHATVPVLPPEPKVAPEGVAPPSILPTLVAPEGEITPQTSWPTGLAEALGPDLAFIVRRLIFDPDNEKNWLTAQQRTKMESLAKSHKEWSIFINRILGWR